MLGLELCLLQRYGNIEIVFLTVPAKPSTILLNSQIQCFISRIHQQGRILNLLQALHLSLAPSYFRNLSEATIRLTFLAGVFSLQVRQQILRTRLEVVKGGVRNGNDAGVPSGALPVQLEQDVSGASDVIV